MFGWTSGHGEGWALYAERLMDELGYMDDPGNKMGLLDSQSLRAARVVIDIGVHCGFEAPAEVGGGEWTYDKAWQYLNAHANQGEASLRFELDRYLGWPGQAPSYKIGERLWMQLRDQVAGARGRRVLAQGLPPPGARHRRRRARHAARGGPRRARLTFRPRRLGPEPDRRPTTGGPP